MTKGIAYAGNMVVDILKNIDCFPERHGLVSIRSMSRSLGGAVCNCIQDTARLDPNMPLKAIGLVGDDSEGKLVLETLGKYPNIDLGRVGFADHTSFSDVLAEMDTKARTFLYYRGASALLDIDHFDLDTLDCDILHVGYILLLDALDAPDPEYGTRLARLLHAAQQKGIRTSVDVVSETGDRYKKLVPPSLKYCDYCVLNEIEAGATCSIPLRDENEKLLVDRIPDVLRAFQKLGVKRWTVIHSPEGGFGIDEDGTIVMRPSLKLPAGFVQGTTGAGDAFCAGVLHAACAGENLRQAIDDGVASAAISLRTIGASEGMGPLEEARALAKRYQPESFVY